MVRIVSLHDIQLVQMWVSSPVVPVCCFTLMWHTVLSPSSSTDTCTCTRTHTAALDPFHCNSMRKQYTDSDGRQLLHQVVKLYVVRVYSFIPYIRIVLYLISSAVLVLCCVPVCPTSVNHISISCTTLSVVYLQRAINLFSLHGYHYNIWSSFLTLLCANFIFGQLYYLQPLCLLRLSQQNPHCLFFRNGIVCLLLLNPLPLQVMVQHILCEHKKIHMNLQAQTFIDWPLISSVLDQLQSCLTALESI